MYFNEFTSFQLVDVKGGRDNEDVQTHDTVHMICISFFPRLSFSLFSSNVCIGYFTSRE